MPFFPGSFGSGVMQGQQAGQQMQMQQAQLAQMLQAMSQRKQLFDQQQQAHQMALRGLQNQGAVLGDVFGAPPQPPAPGVSSQPGTPNGGQPPPGGSAQGGGVVPATPAATPPASPPPDPWKSIQQSTQGMGGQGMSPQAAGMTPQLGSPPPPAQPQGKPQGDVKNGVSQVPDPQEMMRKIVAAGKARNIPDEELGKLVQDLYPVMASMQKQRVDEFRAEVQGLLGAMRGQAAMTNAGAAVTRANTGVAGEARKLEQGNARLDQGDARLDQGQQRIDNRGAGGTGGGKKPSMGNYNQFTRQEEQMLKPIEDAQRQTQEIRGLIASGDPSSMTQVQKLLSQYLQQGRMTNQMYGDNKSFGVVYERAANAISRFAQGDYSDKNKQIILDMVNKMDKTVFSPAREKVIKLNKERLKKMGGDESIADRPATFGGDDGARKPTFSSKRQLEEAIAAKTVKKGDVFLDPDGNQHVVQ